MTINYNMKEMMPVPLCSYYITQDEEEDGDNECPADGSYQFAVNFALPSAGGETTSWLATGWAGTGTFSIYAEPDTSMLIGQCKFSLKTYVTTDEERGIFQTPSAAASVGMALGTLAALVLVVLYMRCCRRRNQDEQQKAGLASLSSDDISTLFKRLDDETRSHLSTDSQLRFAGLPPSNIEHQTELIDTKKPHSSNDSEISAMAL